MRLGPFLLALSLVGASSFAQTSTPSAEQVLDQIRQQQLQHQAELARMQSDMERWRLERDQRRLTAEQERQALLLRLQLGQRESDASEATKKAEEAADEVREELHLAGVRSADTVYLALAIGLPGLLGIFIARKAAKEGAMKYEQKFGTMVMVGALLLMLLAITISDGWINRLDAVQNIMESLRISFFHETDSSFSARLIDFPTKYLLAALACVFAYGFTTYLDITPAWKRAAAIGTPATSDS